MDFTNTQAVSHHSFVPAYLSAHRSPVALSMVYLNSPGALVARAVRLLHVKDAQRLEDDTAYTSTMPLAVPAYMMAYRSAVQQVRHLVQKLPLGIVLMLCGCVLRFLSLWKARREREPGWLMSCDACKLRCKPRRTVVGPQRELVLLRGGGPQSRGHLPAQPLVVAVRQDHVQLSHAAVAHVPVWWWWCMCIKGVCIRNTRGQKDAATGCCGQPRIPLFVQRTAYGRSPAQSGIYLIAYTSLLEAVVVHVY